MTCRAFSSGLRRLVLGGLALLAAAGAHADVVFLVDTTADLIDDNVADGACHTLAGTCSLRAAVMQANHRVGPGAAIISLPAGTYVLTRAPAGANGDDTGDLNVTAPLASGQSVSIVGARAATTIIDANHFDRALAVEVGSEAHLSGVTIRNGRPPGSTFGGGIFNRGTLVITDAVIRDNQSAEGGGIDSSGTLTIARTSVRSNIAQYGGGLYVYGDTRIRDSTIAANIASPGSGGGIFNANELRIVNGTLTLNAADTDGGGIYNNYKAYLYSTSIIDNDADHDRDENGGIGGGVRAEPSGGAQFVIVNTLLARNTLFDSPIYDDCSGTLEAFSWNLLAEASGCTLNGPWGFVSPTTIGPLQDNGGPTMTQALLAGSEAIDPPSGSSSCVDDEGEDMPTDQRGAARVAGPRCDIGAFEFGSVVPGGDVIFRDGFNGP
ncbi:choice-of-anchor Q domain-containing protein [Dokdonella sp.]|uniref:choice-of-anchor Q domain-containing protein n=1 Tax=Dokdonella sp. TaxID=2291710 RepID=UPI0037833FE9